MSKNIFYKENIKDSWSLYKKQGITIIIFLILFGVAKDYIFIPLMGKAWGLVLTTTPEGFISNANLVNAIIKSPWIIPCGLVLIIFYALISMWQVSAIIISASYMYHDKQIKLLDLIKISFKQLKHRINKNNWMLLIYSLIIIPFANIYQTNDVISSFTVPEYIQDFINNNTVLFILFIIVVLFVIYIALRWFFLLPSFILKKNDFKEAKNESNNLTNKTWIKDGLNIVIYSVIEFIRISIVPIILIMLPALLCYAFSNHLNFSTQLFNTIGITFGFEIIKSITGTLVQVSSICFMTSFYYTRLKEKNISTETSLPELKYNDPRKISLNKFLIVSSIIFSIVVAGTYLVTVNIVQTNSEIIFDIFNSTEIIAHKGYSSKAPENTMPAFKLADGCKEVSYIELDVWSSKDGVPVVIHNENIKDATGIDKEIYECTVDELKNIPAPYNMDKTKFKNTYIPTLEEVIKEYADSTPLLIEIKGFKQDKDLPKKIVELMKKYGCEYTSLVHSGDYGALKAIKEVDPDISCGLILAIVTGNYYDLPYADFFSIEHTFVDQHTIALIHRRGKGVFAWTVNYAESAENLKFSGVDGIITDVPEEINTYVSDTNTLIEDAFNNMIIDLFINDSAVSAITNYESGDY